MFFRKKNQGIEISSSQKKVKKKKTRRIIAIIVIILLVIVAVIRCSGSQNTVMSVDVTKVTQGSISSTLDTSGTINTENSKVFASPVNATVSKVNVQAGDIVNAGDYLLMYDTTSLEQNYDLATLEAKATKATETDSVTKSGQAAKDKSAAQASIDDLNNQINAKNSEIGALNATLVGYQQQNNSVTAQLEQSSTAATAGTLSSQDKQTYDNLKKQSTDLANAIVSAQADASTKQTELSNLQAKLADAQTKKQTADAAVLSNAQKENLDYSTQKTNLSLTDAQQDLSKAKAGVATDFNGIVTSVDVTAGAVTQEGQSLITVADASNMRVECKVSKYNLNDLAVGQKANITFLNKTYQGSVTSISHVAAQSATKTGTATTSTTMVTADIHIDNPDSNLVIGMDTKVNILLGTKENVLVVPISAVNSNKNGDFVYIIQKGKIVKKDVTTGLANNENIEIASGLEKGDKVITSVDSTIQEGLPATAHLEKEKQSKTTEAKQTSEATTDKAKSTETKQSTSAQ